MTHSPLRLCVCTGLLIACASLLACRDDSASGPAETWEDQSTTDAGGLDAYSQPTSEAEDDAGPRTDPGELDARSGSAPEAGLGTDGARDGATALPDVPEGPPATLTEYCDAVGRNYFRWQMLCFGASQFPEASRETAVADEIRGCELASSALDAGRIGFDPAAAGRCVRQLTAQTSCEGFRFAGGHCDQVFVPKLQLGERCEGHGYFFLQEECVEGYCERIGSHCTFGTCRAYKRLEEPCELFKPCEPELWCGFRGVCEPRPALGESCTLWTCAAGLTCDLAGTCVPLIPAGEACTAGSICDSSSCLDGRCRTKVQLGEACDSNLNCYEPSLCIDGDGDGAEPPRCAPPGEQQLGQSCQDDRHCASTLCDFGKCRARIAPGQPCAYDACDHGWCRLTSNVGPGTCVPTGHEGDDCSDWSGASHSRTACQPSLMCMSDRRCHPRGGLDQPCLVTEPSSCESGLWCSRETLTCRQPAAQGETCNPLFHVRTCAAGLGCACGTDDWCDTDGSIPTPTDTCQPLQDTDGPCRRNLECLSGFCSGVVCLPPIAPPLPCPD